MLHGEDRRAWPGNRQGAFSVSNAYELLAGLHLGVPDRNWKCELRVGVP